MKPALSLLSCLLVSACSGGIDVLGIEIAPRCIPEVHARILRSADFDTDANSPVVLLAASNTGDANVTGLDPQGVPTGAGVLSVLAVGTASRDQVLTAHGVPYTTWFVAFVDLNGDRALSAGEPMGIDPSNPHVGGCGPYGVAIDIDRSR